MRANGLVLCAWSVLMSACRDATEDGAPGVAASPKSVATGLSLSIAAPTEDSVVAVTLEPGDPFLFQGSFFWVKGATPKEIRRGTPVVWTGDVIAIRSRRAEVRYTAVALSEEGQLLAIPQADAPEACAVFSVIDDLRELFGAGVSCMQTLAIARDYCLMGGGSPQCCDSKYSGYVHLCANLLGAPLPDAASLGNTWAAFCADGGGGATGGGDDGTGGEDTGTGGCGPETECVIDESITVDGADCSYTGVKHNGKDADGQCISWLVDGEGLTTCDVDGDGEDDTCDALNFNVGEVAGAGG